MVLNTNQSINQSINIVYYIDFTCLFELIRHFKKEFVFHCWTLNDICDCNDVGSVMSHNEINVFISLGEIPFFFFLFEISVFHRHLYNHNKVHVVILISQSQ